MEIHTEMVRYAEGVHALEQGMVRCFLIVGDERALLLDAGVAPVDLRPEIARITDRPLIVALTHGDGDHTAGLEGIERVHAHPAERPRLQESLGSALPEIVPVEEGHVFDLGGVRLRVLHTPGHTPGSICLLDEARGALYSGDSISNGPVFLYGPGREIDTYARTLARVEALGGIERIYPCHGACPVGPDAIGELRACARGIMEGTLAGSKPTGHDFGNPALRVYTVGRSGILYAP
mgnify:CR=1 FL=1